MLEKKKHDKEAYMPRKEEAKHAMQKQYWKKLTVTKMAERRTKELCFNCDELYTRDHVCNPVLFHIMPFMDEDDQEDEPF